MAWSHGHFYWNEFLARDIDRAKKFYGENIGWTFESMPMPDGNTYWVAKQSGEPVGGMFVMNLPDHVPEHWFSYIAVDDVDTRTKKAQAAGAKLMRPIFDVPGVGRIAILEQPGGAGVGWMTPVSS